MEFEELKRWLWEAISLLGESAYNRSDDGMSVRHPPAWHDAREARWLEDRRDLIRACYDSLESVAYEHRRKVFEDLTARPAALPAEVAEGREEESCES